MHLVQHPAQRCSIAVLILWKCFVVLAGLQGLFYDFTKLSHSATCLTVLAHITRVAYETSSLTGAGFLSTLAQGRHTLLCSTNRQPVKRNLAKNVPT